VGVLLPTLTRPIEVIPLFTLFMCPFIFLPLMEEKEGHHSNGGGAKRVLEAKPMRVGGYGKKENR